MPPPNRIAYDIACVALAVTEILSRAAAIQAEQVLGRRTPRRDWYGHDIGMKAGVNTGSEPPESALLKEDVMVPPAPATAQAQQLYDSIPPRPAYPPIFDRYIHESPSQKAPSEVRATSDSPLLDASMAPAPLAASLAEPPVPIAQRTYVPEVPALKRAVPVAPQLLPLAEIDEERAPVVMKASKVPSSALGRFFHYGSLAAGLTTGAATEYIRRQTGSSGGSAQSSVMMSEANVTRLVNKLSQMRGAALKLGQFMSIQDAHVLPDQIEQILRRVQNSAHYMPQSQMEAVLTRELGENWKGRFEEFDPIPMASASIGQVHRATLSPTSPSYPSDMVSSTSPEPLPLAVKVQFPGVESSITSDIRTITLLLSSTTALLPKGLFLDKTMEVFKEELADECNYLREAESAVRFAKELEGDGRFRVPKILGINEGMTTKNVLVMERMKGTPLGAAVKWEQEVRDEIGRSLLVLCFKELFQFRFMQTDPNWSNFLYNRQTRQIELVDFGASREYSKEFMDKWYLLLKAAIEGDREAGIEQSLALGYLVGGENEKMIDAHLQSLVLLGKPFSASTAQPFDFASNRIPTDIRELIPVMLQNRLTPPPRETYSLNRKLSGTILLCGRLRARVDCRSVWEEVVGDYTIG